MSSKQYFGYIQDNNKTSSTIYYKNHMEMREGWVNWTMTFDCDLGHWIRMESWVGMKNLVFCSGSNVPSLFGILQSLFYYLNVACLVKKPNKIEDYS
jgi:hypothetical protein